MDSLDAKLEKVAKSDKEAEMKILMGNYTMDTIARCAFATKLDTHNDPNNPFVVNAIKVFSVKMWRAVLFLTFKRLTKLLSIPPIDFNATLFFKNAVRL